jgi:hypothetical protein
VLPPPQLASAGLDVFPNEPEIDERLVAMDNITLLPHMGTETKDTQHKVSFADRGHSSVNRTACLTRLLLSAGQMEALTIRNIISAIKGQGLLNQVAEQKQ